jgi:chorismate mutase
MGTKQMMVRGVRGAISISQDEVEEVLASTRRLLLTIVEQNEINSEDLASVWLTTTPDIVSCFPAIAARQIGWVDVPLICAHEMNVQEAMPLVVRVMMHWNTTKSQKEIKHIYLGETVKLRPDKVHVPPISDEDIANYMLEHGLA